ncbi:cytidine deaminase [Gordonia asplenii]|uniref:cytidine deaminase n=1 Tax=Gordonia asplenii TaxID=2725283 RepID=UPI0028A9A49E|nr:cytidine deaminase [Gordonia asplenii]
MSATEWKLLHDKAVEAMRNAYAPYSDFPVGAAAVVDDGRFVRGCNVENVSYGLGVCAEVTLAGNLAVTGGGRLVAVSVCDSRGEPLTPCGRCRQILLEHGGVELLVATANGPVRLGDLLPDAFGPDDLERGRR